MQRLIETSCALAAQELGNENAEKIAKAAQKRYEELLIENAGESKALRRHTSQRIYPAIAVYEAFRAEGVAPETAVWYIREYFQVIAAQYVPHLRRMIGLFGLAKKIPKLFMKISQKSFGTDAGFEYVFPASQGNEARFNIPFSRSAKRQRMVGNG